MKKLLLPILALTFSSAFAGNFKVKNDTKATAMVTIELPGKKIINKEVPAGGYRKLKGVNKIDAVTVKLDKMHKNNPISAVIENDIKIKNNKNKALCIKEKKGHLILDVKEYKMAKRKAKKCERPWWKFWGDDCAKKKVKKNNNKRNNKSK